MSTTLETAPEGDNVGFVPRAIPGLVHGFRMLGDTGAEELAPDLPFDTTKISQQSWCWLHLNLADVRACAWLDTLAEVPVSVRAFLRAHHDHQQLNDPAVSSASSPISRVVWSGTSTVQGSCTLP